MVLVLRSDTNITINPTSDEPILPWLPIWSCSHELLLPLRRAKRFRSIIAPASARLRDYPHGCPDSAVKWRADEYRTPTKTNGKGGTCDRTLIQACVQGRHGTVQEDCCTGSSVLRAPPWQVVCTSEPGIR